VDYAALADQITEMASASRFLLIEKFASEVLRIVLAHPLVRWAEVEVINPLRCTTSKRCPSSCPERRMSQ
jgi:dihydroneopterin aldolase